MAERSIRWWKKMLGMSPMPAGDQATTTPPQPEKRTRESPASSSARKSTRFKTSGGGLPKDFELTDEFKEAFDLLENGPQVIFVTGRAGTGKSTLLRFFRLNTPRQVAVVAPTGVAALNVGGQTIHSFFRFPPRPIASTDIKRVRDRRLYQSVDILVIDEISMVRADMLDGIDRFMRLNGKNKNRPFGGARVIMFGDPYQLPPIVSNHEESSFLADNYATPYFFSANVLKETNLETIELQENFRQKEVEFMDLLDQVRIKSKAAEVVQTLNERCLLPDYADSPEGSIVLTSTNKRAEHINTAKLDELETEEFFFEAEATGEFLTASTKRFPAPALLTLKEGAQVMFLRNSLDHGFVNGSMGVITSLSEYHIEALVYSAEGDHTTVVNTATWESYKYKYDPTTKRIEAEVVGSYTQYPLMLAWATTIHKSQGKTFDLATLDLTDRAFAHGQVYVALSRCRTLKGLSLRVPIKTTDIRVDTSVIAFANRVTKRAVERR